MKLKKLYKKGEDDGGIPWKLLAIIAAVIIMIIGLIIIAKGDGALSKMFNLLH